MPLLQLVLNIEWKIINHALNGIYTVIFHTKKKKKKSLLFHLKSKKQFEFLIFFFH